MRHLKNIHPGEVLQEEFLLPMGISVYRIAKETGLSPTRLGQIIKGNRGITAETAIKIGLFLNTGPEFWMNLQSLYDIEEAERLYSKEVKTIHPYSRTARAAEVTCNKTIGLSP